MTTRSTRARRSMVAITATATVGMLMAGLGGPVSAQDKVILDVVSLRPGSTEDAFHAFDAQVTQGSYERFQVKAGVRHAGNQRFDGYLGSDAMLTQRLDLT